MQYEVDVDGRARQVTIHRTDGVFEVTLDGRTWRVDAARVDPHTLSLVIESGQRGAASYDVGFAQDPATGLLSVRVGTTEVRVALNGGRRRSVGADGTAAGPQRIVAPMPGKIVRVGVKTGDAVRARQTLVVVEAMKMENELKAVRDGVVSELHAREGAPVDAGALLIVIR